MFVKRQKNVNHVTNEIKHKIGETWPARERSCLRGSRLEIVSSLSINTFHC